MPSPSRYYSSTAAKTTLSNAIDASASSLTLAAPAGLPSQYPYTLILEKDTGSEEIVTVTGLVGTSYQITRGVDGSSAKAHSVGATVEHGVSARDYTESRAHEIATTAHGVTGDVVGTSGAQTLSSKTITSGTLGSDLAAGGYKITGLATPTSSSDAATKNYIDTQTTSAAASASSAAVSAASAATSASSALTSQGSAAVSASSSATSATAAATSAASALASQTAAATSAASALTSQTAAATSATSALTAATAASTSAASAATSATSAATSASSALISANSAAASATTAAASVATIAGYATTASNSAAAAATSATSASASASAAATSAANAATSATAAATSAASALTSATSAATSASSALTSQTAAATSASSAATSASSALTSATAAATSATSAATSASSASASASAAATSAASASTSATSAATSAALAASIVAGAIQGTLIQAKGDLLVGTADDAVTNLSVGTNGYLLTAASTTATGLEWAPAPVSLPSQAGNAGEFLTTDGTTASWAPVAGSLAQPTEPTSPSDGQIWIDTDGTAPTTVVTRWSKQPASGTTSLSGNDDYSIPLAYSAGYEQVFLNGTLLSRGNDYTATSGTTITLSTSTVTGDIVEVICPLQISTTDTYTQSAVNNAFQANTNNFAAGKNKIINGDFSIWQRGATSATSGGWNYFADRWQTYNYGGTYSPSRQTFTPGSAPVAGYEAQYFLRINSTSTFSTMATLIEDVRTLAGQTATFSLWAKSNTSNTLKLTFAQGFGTGGSSAVDIVPQQTVIGSLTTSWQRFTYTVNIPSISGKTIGTGSHVFIQLLADASKDLDVWGVQLEAGSNATAFQTATGNPASEYAACQRYYFRTQTGSSESYMGVTVAGSATTTYANVIMKQTMRAAPTSVDFSGIRWQSINNSGNITAVAISSATPDNVLLNCTTTGATTGAMNYLNAATNTGYVGFSAEL